MKRRTFLNGTLAAGMLGVAASAGLLTPRRVLAAWPESAFTSKSIEEALDKLHGMSSYQESADVQIEAPDIAENGAVVPISVTTSLAAESITILVPKNPSSLACTFDLASNAAGDVSTRIKMGETSDVVAVVKSGGKLYSAKKLVKVTIGGCGG